MTKEQFLAGVPFTYTKVYGRLHYQYFPRQGEDTTGYGHITEFRPDFNMREYHCNVSKIVKDKLYVYTALLGSCAEAIIRLQDLTEII